MKKSLACLLMFVSLILLTPAPIANAQQNAAANPLGCTLSAVLSTATATAQIIAAPPVTSKPLFVNGAASTTNTSQQIKVCAFFINVKQTTTAANFGLISGTGTNCGTGAANVTSQAFGTVSINNDKMQAEYGPGTWLAVGQAKALCLKLSSAPTDSTATVLYRLE